MSDIYSEKQDQLIHDIIYKKIGRKNFNYLFEDIIKQIIYDDYNNYDFCFKDYINLIKQKIQKRENYIDTYKIKIEVLKIEIAVNDDPDFVNPLKGHYILDLGNDYVLVHPYEYFFDGKDGIKYNNDDNNNRSGSGFRKMIDDEIEYEIKHYEYFNDIHDMVLKKNNDLNDEEDSDFKRYNYYKQLKKNRISIQQNNQKEELDLDEIFSNDTIDTNDTNDKDKEKIKKQEIIKNYLYNDDDIDKDKELLEENEKEDDYRIFKNEIRKQKLNDINTFIKITELMKKCLSLFIEGQLEFKQFCENDGYI